MNPTVRRTLSKVPEPAWARVSRRIAVSAWKRNSVSRLGPIDAERAGGVELGLELHVRRRVLLGQRRGDMRREQRDRGFRDLGEREPHHPHELQEHVFAEQGAARAERGEHAPRRAR